MCEAVFTGRIIPVKYCIDFYWSAFDDYSEKSALKLHAELYASIHCV